MKESKETPEWFPMYWARFIIGTLDMSAEEIGAYFLLLIHEWDKGFVPVSDKELKKICKISAKKLEKVLKKFEKIGEKYFNNTLESIRIQQAEKSAKYSERGFKGAEAKWNKHKLSIIQASSKHHISNGIREGERDIKKEKESESDLDAFMESQTWKEAICMKHKIKPDKLPEFFKEFFIHLKTQGKEKSSIGEKKSHFDNWLGKKIVITPKTEQYPYKKYE